MKLENKKVMVTGGAGFIGSHLVDELITEKPADIVIVDDMSLGKERNLKDAREASDDITLYVKDASDFDSMKKIFEDHKIDVVFDLAVIPLPASLVDPKHCTDKNLEIVSTICELQRQEYFKRTSKKTSLHCSHSYYGYCNKCSSWSRSCSKGR